MIGGGLSGRDPGDWRGVARGVIAIAAVLLVLDACTLLRLAAFESQPPAATRASGRIWYVAGRRGGTMLRFETSNGWINLTTGPSTVLGSAWSGVDSMWVRQNAMADVAWIDAPAGVFHGTIHYPIHVEQAGRVLLHLDGPKAVAEAERVDLLQEALLVGIGMFGVPALLLAIARRRDKARRDALSLEWRERRGRARAGDPPGSTSA